MKKAINTIEKLNLAFDQIRAKFEAKGKVLLEWTTSQQVRNLDQNALYWVWVACLTAETSGFNENGKPAKIDMQDIHNILRRKFLPIQEKIVLGEKVKTLTSTSTLDRKPFADYMSEIKAYAYQDHGVVLLSKRDVGYDEMYFKYKGCKV